MVIARNTATLWPLDLGGGREGGREGVAAKLNSVRLCVRTLANVLPPQSGDTLIEMRNVPPSGKAKVLHDNRAEVLSLRSHYRCRPHRILPTFRFRSYQLTSSPILAKSWCPFRKSRSTDELTDFRDYYFKLPAPFAGGGNFNLNYANRPTLFITAIVFTQQLFLHSNCGSRTRLVLPSLSAKQY